MVPIAVIYCIWKGIPTDKHALIFSINLQEPALVFSRLGLNYM